MGEELVGRSSSTEGGVSAGRSSTLLTYGEQFEKLFPVYLTYGMSADEYWNGDATLVVGFREAFRMKQELLNQSAWVQGMYFYDALCNASPLFVATGKKGTIKARPYAKEPYDLGFRTEEQKVDKEKLEMEKMRSKMEMFMIRNNHHYKTKKEV